MSLEEEEEDDDFDDRSTSATPMSPARALSSSLSLSTLDLLFCFLLLALVLVEAFGCAARAAAIRAFCRSRAAFFLDEAEEEEVDSEDAADFLAGIVGAGVEDSDEEEDEEEGVEEGEDEEGVAVGVSNLTLLLVGCAFDCFDFDFGADFTLARNSLISAFNAAPARVPFPRAIRASS